VVDTLITGAGAATLVLLDSCRHRSTHILSNAVGKFDDDQLDEARAHPRHGRRAAALHLAPPRVARCAVPPARRLVQRRGRRRQARRDPRDYRQRAASNHVLVCHGHRHALSAGMIGERGAEIAVVGLPSTTLGDKSIDGMLDGCACATRSPGCAAMAAGRSRLQSVGALAAGRRAAAREAGDAANAAVRRAGGDRRCAGRSTVIGGGRRRNAGT